MLDLAFHQSIVLRIYDTTDSIVEQKRQASPPMEPIVGQQNTFVDLPSTGFGDLDTHR
jgi:hypothetical protein